MGFEMTNRSKASSGFSPGLPGSKCHEGLVGGYVRCRPYSGFPVNNREWLTVGEEREERQRADGGWQKCRVGDIFLQ
jgi:hypothetical protein